MAGEKFVRDWSFKTDQTKPRYRSYLIELAGKLRMAPRKIVMRSARPAPAWTLYFIYAPDGALGDAHRFTLARLKALNRKLLVVCAVPDPRSVPEEIFDIADALIWKQLSGYDFSAYSAGLWHLAAKSPHADVLVLNDSSYGPFADLDPLIEQARWDLTGFTSCTDQEVHIQSYAFLLRDVTRRRMAKLWSIFPRWLAFDDIVSVINYQEIRFARVASRYMTVGSLWHSPDRLNSDPTLFGAEALLDTGFPFIKKSALGKKRKFIGEEIAARLEDRLVALGHPLP